jgi:hypothetical protein
MCLIVPVGHSRRLGDLDLLLRKLQLMMMRRARPGLVERYLELPHPEPFRSDSLVL